MTETAPYTIPEFTKDDFHNQVGANIYRYPFSVEGSRFPVVSDEETVKYPPLDASFEKVELSGTKYEYYVEPGLDLHESITRCSADGVVEVAGPTTDGFLALENTDLLCKPVITNIAGSRTIDAYRETVKSDTLVPIDSIVLDALADTRHLPIRDSSVGVLLASCVMRSQGMPNFVDHEGNELVSFDDRVAYFEVYKSFINDLYASAIKKIEADGINMADVDREIVESPRIGLMIEASRILEPGGLFVLKGASSEDLLLAQTLGLRLIAHRPMTSKEGDILFDTTPKEIVLQKHN